MSGRAAVVGTVSGGAVVGPVSGGVPGAGAVPALTALDALLLSADRTQPAAFWPA